MCQGLTAKGLSTLLEPASHPQRLFPSRVTSQSKGRKAACHLSANQNKQRSTRYTPADGMTSEIITCSRLPGMNSLETPSLSIVMRRMTPPEEPSRAIAWEMAAIVERDDSVSTIYDDSQLIIEFSAWHCVCLWVLVCATYTSSRKPGTPPL